jgi:hypothetical protein
MKTLYEARKTMFARIMALIALFFAFSPLLLPNSGLVVHAMEPGTIVYNSGTSTESSGDTGLNGFDVTMGEDGNVSVSGMPSSDTDSWTTIFNNYKKIIMGFSGLATLTFVVLFIKNFMSLGANADNPTGRRSAITGCLWTGIATALCGSIMVVVGLFWNAFK